MNINTQRILSEVYWLRIFLIIITLVEICYFAITFFSPDMVDFHQELKIRLDSFKLMWLLHNSSMLVLIIYIWKKYPAKKQQKKQYIYMILFLGIIGAWLWLPNKKEVEQLANNQG